MPRVKYVTLGVIFLWPAATLQIWPVPKLGTSKRKDFPAWISARKAYELSYDKWMQICWNAEENDYDVTEAEDVSIEPQWPNDKSFNDLLKTGFDGKIIDNEDHEYARQLRGLAT